MTQASAGTDSTVAPIAAVRYQIMDIDRAIRFYTEALASSSNTRPARRSRWSLAVRFSWF